MLNRGLLGWRQPRANDYQGPDARPLRDTFASLQQYMTWPHFGVTIDATQAVNAGLTVKTITAFEDPYQLVRNSTDTIQAPRDFDRWMFMGTASAYLAVNGPSRLVLSWFYNGTNAFPDLDDQTNTDAGATDGRVSSTVMFPVAKGDTLSIAIYSDVAGTVDAGRAWGMFLPLV